VRPALLFLAQRLPYPPHRGDKIRALQIIQHFSRDYDVHVGTLIDDMADRAHIEALRAHCASLYVAEVQKPGAYLKALPAYLAGAPISFAVFQNTGLQAWVNETCAKYNPEIGIMFSSNVADYALRALKRPKILIADFADVDSVKWRDFEKSATPPKSWIYGLEARRVSKREKEIATMVNAVTFVTPDETALFAKLYPEVVAKALTVGMGVDIDFFDPSLSFDPLTPDTSKNIQWATFTGTMDYWPNEQAAIWFVENILDPVRARGVDLHLSIVGTRPTKAVQALAKHPAVIVTGRVADVRPYFARGDIVVSPMQIARGIQTKVLEAMAMGKPIILTPGALTGIDATPDIHARVASTKTEWIAACVALLQNKAERDRMGAAARTCVVEKYSVAAQLSGFNHIIDMHR
jgi:polysaccharide biosynthesis protein PslH